MIERSPEPVVDRRQIDVDLLAAFDRVRDELGQDITESEHRVTAQIETLRRDVDVAALDHARVHSDEETTRATKHDFYDQFIKRAEIAQARRDGALGVIRFAADLIGRNWRGILAVGGVAAFLLGQVQVDVGVGP